ncbi:MAG: hypothetical protein LBC75_04915 [Fibromonadaceae bacterium]|nr:hypothetical protein [Fibromonadaceae bacterium]
MNKYNRHLVKHLKMGKLEGYLNEDTSSITALGVASNPATSSPIDSNIVKNEPVPLAIPLFDAKCGLLLRQSTPQTNSLSNCVAECYLSEPRFTRLKDFQDCSTKCLILHTTDT